MRFVLFLVTALGVWASMHLYVFWRLSSVPWVAAHIPRLALVIAATALGISYPLSRFLYSRGLDIIAKPVEFIGGNWIGVLFLLLSALLVLDVITLGGYLLPHRAAELRGWAVIAGLVLSGIALMQGMRPPVVHDYEVRLPGLPEERDGLVMVGISDTHLGTLIGPRWIEHVVNRINGMNPDLVVVLGDLVDTGHGREKPFIPVLSKLKAPLGVWAVIGNHEYYGGLDRNIRIMEEAGFTVLRDRWAEAAPGLIVAGVDDLTARREFGQMDHPVEKALANRPDGAAILLSHTPWQYKEAAAAGAGLMLSGHTHNGQIWPFNYITKLTYRLSGGRYKIGGMTVIVGPGTGTWGSRMRLWLPGEILRIRLRTETK